MKTRHFILPCLLWSLHAASPVWAVRDPFWPIGYSPAPPASEKELEPVRARAPEPKPEPPREKPVTEDDWAKARKALAISGTTSAVKPGTNEARTLVMINRQMFAIGDTVSFVYTDIRFQWRIVSVTDKETRLDPVQAERVVQKPRDLTQ